MTEGLTDDEKLTRAARAEALMRNELLTEAFDVLERSYFDGWKASGAKETDNRERLYVAAQIVGMIRGHLLDVITTGKVAQSHLDAVEYLSKEDKAKFFGISV